MRRMAIGILMMLVLALQVCGCAPNRAAAEPAPSAGTPSPLASPTIEASQPPLTHTPTFPPPSPTPDLSPIASPGTPPHVTLTPIPTLTTLLFTGVIVPARCVQAAIDARDDVDYPYEQVRGLIQDADLAIGTLNATLSDHSPRTGCVRTYVLVGEANNADALQRAGFDLMSTATNHIKNCGLTNCGDRAFFDTLQNLRRVGITPIGAGAEHSEAMQPVVVELNGVRFGFVSLGHIEPLAFAGPYTPGIAVLTPENLKAAIAAARRVADVVIAMPHWGPEDSPTPTYIQRDLAQKAVEYGADLVIGNHTHVVQGWQQIDGVPVFYGLGNFVFDQDLRDHQQGVILRVYFEGAHYTGFDLIPTHVDQDGAVSIAEAGEAAEVLERMRLASLPVGTQGWLPGYLSSLPLDDLADMAQDAAVQKLFEQWLQYAASPNLENNQRLSAYEIHRVQEAQALAAAYDVEYLASVLFSVKPAVPASQPSHWHAGNGELGEDGWVRNKSLFVGLRQQGGRLWLVILGTGL